MADNTYRAIGRIDRVGDRVLDHGELVELDAAGQAEHQHLIDLGALELVESSPVAIAEMSKAELRAYALEEFGTTLDSGLNKQQLLDEVVKLEAERVGSVAVGDDGQPNDGDEHEDEGQGDERDPAKDPSLGDPEE